MAKLARLELRLHSIEVPYYAATRGTGRRSLLVSAVSAVALAAALSSASITPASAFLCDSTANPVGDGGADDGGQSTNVACGDFAHAIGTGAGGFNTAVGSGAGVNSDAANGQGTAVGASAGVQVTGSDNTATGFGAGFTVTGSGNTATGSEAGQGLTGSGNVAIGYRAGNSIGTPEDPVDNTIAIGSDGDSSGFGAQATAPGAIAVGVDALSSGTSAVGIGANVQSTGNVSTAVGPGSNAS
jgi:hypothetical protein